MNFQNTFDVVILGVVEGLTEFIPVSSTAHLILIGHFLKFSSPNSTFQVLIQFGPIFSLLSVYFKKLWNLTKTFSKNQDSRYFFFGVVIACFPSIFLGAILHNFIKTILFNSLYITCISLIVGGLILMQVDKMKLNPSYFNAFSYPWKICLKIGMFQCLSLIPGISRSAATIVGALLMGADKRSAAEFSFFLAIPTMTAAFSYDLFKNYHKLSFNDSISMILGFLTSFIVGIFVVRYFLKYISNHGYAFFGWWRSIVGLLGLILLIVLG